MMPVLACMARARHRDGRAVPSWAVTVTVGSDSGSEQSSLSKQGSLRSLASFVLTPSRKTQARTHWQARACQWTRIIRVWNPDTLIMLGYPDIYRDIPSYDGIAWYMEVYDGYIRIMPPSSFHTWG
jgi:hypothetical protein